MEGLTGYLLKGAKGSSRQPQSSCLKCLLTRKAGMVSTTVNLETNIFYKESEKLFAETKGCEHVILSFYWCH